MVGQRTLNPFIYVRIVVRQHMGRLSNSEKISVWSSIRASINTWVGLLTTLLTSGTALFFVAFGVILANASKVGSGPVTFMSFGLFLGTLGFGISVWHIASALSIVVESAISIEEDLFGKEKSVYKTTTIVNTHPFWGKGKPMNEYYKFWVLGLMIAAGGLTIWRVLIWINIVK